MPADRLIVGDLNEPHRIDQVLLEKQIDAVVHFAAFTYVGESVTQPAKYWQNNVVNTLNLLECLRRHNVKRFVFSSTAATFGIPDAMPITEDDAADSRSIRMGQASWRSSASWPIMPHAYQWGFAALRYFNASGAAADGAIGEDHTPETHLIPLIIQAVLGQRPHIEIFGTDYPTPDGTCIRDYIHVDDLA